MKHRLLLFSILLIMLIPAFAQQAQQAGVNILCYNVHNCIGMDKKQDYQRIANVIQQTAPDIVSLQELDSITERNKGVYALGELEKLTGMHGIYASAIPFQGGSYGIGMLSKEAPIKYEVISMPGREEKRALIIAEFKDYVFCATHQSLTAEDQLLSVPLIQKALKGIHKPIFLAGDMNSKPKSKPQQMLSEQFITLNDTAVYTFPADMPSRCIDYIYAYSQNGYQFEVQQQKVIEEAVASDHRPVQVIVQIKGK